FFFFFSSRRRHTRFSRDWSSDVCSSDLARRESMTSVPDSSPQRTRRPPDRQSRDRRSAILLLCVLGVIHGGELAGAQEPSAPQEIGRASCRERVEVAGGAGAGEKKTVGA